MLAVIAMAAQLPPVVTTVRSDRMLQAWIPGDIRCDGAPVAAVMLRRPYLALVYPGAPASAPLSYRFRIDAIGRPLSIERASVSNAGYSQDVAPSLAASRFAAGAARRGCTITYTARRTGYAETPTPDLVSYSLNPEQGRLPQEGWAAIYPADATCRDEPRPAPLLQAYPDFPEVAGTAGVRDWTMLAYDLDAKGAPVRVRVATGTGNATLDVAARRALARSRYRGGPRTGCRFPFWKAPATLPAPPAPERAAFRPEASTCPVDLAWVAQPTLVYPEPYRRRAIEGWAVIGFDLAPWGATGRVKVLASEPSDEFGQAAAQLIRASSAASVGNGATGCVERVNFVMARPGQAPVIAAAP